ncbi:MAG: DMT family transporter [Alphaproteobacteria bacterium]|nr:DMT family transporter [Alphaproteobacteria bacterium]
MRSDTTDVDQEGAGRLASSGKSTLQVVPAAADNVRGAVYMMLSMAGFVLNDTLMKSLSADLPMFQAIFLRGVVATLLIGALAWHRRALWYRPSATAAKIISLRVVGEIGATVCFITALFNMPIANATAILQVNPLAVTLGAALFLGEAVGWRRYSAIIVGFLGVMLIVRPGSEGFTIYSVYALSAVVFFVLRDLITRRLPVEVPSLFVTVISSMSVMTMAGMVSATGSWQPVTLTQLAILALAAVFVLVGYLFGVMTMRVGDIGFISPFRYTILLWAILLGIVVFGDIPDGPTLLGSAIVVLTGLYTFHRERAAAAAARAS